MLMLIFTYGMTEGSIYLLLLGVSDGGATDDHLVWG